MRPYACIAVGLQFGAHTAARCALRILLRATQHALQVLHMVAELVRNDVLLSQRSTAGTELVLQHVEEVGIEIGGLVGRAIERPDITGRRPAPGVHLAGEQPNVCGR